MNLKEARDKNKLSQFIKEQEKKTAPANRSAFNRTVKSMISSPSQKLKPKRGTSPKGSGGC